MGVGPGLGLGLGLEGLAARMRMVDMDELGAMLDLDPLPLTPDVARAQFVDAASKAFDLAFRHFGEDATDETRATLELAVTLLERTDAERGAHARETADLANALSRSVGSLEEIGVLAGV